MLRSCGSGQWFHRIKTFLHLFCFLSNIFKIFEYTRYFAECTEISELVYCNAREFVDSKHFMEVPKNKKKIVISEIKFSIERKNYFDE